MAAMPFFIKRLGVKKMLAIGMLAWVARYVAFGSLKFSFVLFGLFLHGVCYDFFFVASQIYVDSRASAAQRASAQSFIAFVTLGVGMFVGTYVGGWIVDQHTPKIAATIEPEAGGARTQARVSLPNWDPEGQSGLARALELTDQSLLAIDAIPESVVDVDAKTKTSTIYLRDDLIAVAKAADRDRDGKVSRNEWRQAQNHDWFHIWLWPAIAAAVTCGLFLIGFRPPSAAGSIPE
jgi:hypothetical protein